MRAQSAANKKPFGSLTESQVDRVAERVADRVAAKLAEPQQPNVRPDQLIDWEGVSTLEHRLRRAPDAPYALRQTIWLWVRKGVLPRPVLLGPRSARWRYGDVVKAFTPKP